MRKYVMLFSAISAVLQAQFSVAPLYRYTTLDATGIGNFTGSTGGAEVAYEYVKPCSLYAKVGFDFALGTLSGDVGSIEEQEWDLQGVIGYVAVYECYRVIPYVGGAYRAIKEHLHINGYEQQNYTYKVPYVPFGLALSIRVTPCFTIGANYQYQWTPDPFLTVRSLPGTAWEIDNSYGQLLEVPFEFALGSCFSVSVKPYYQYNKLGGSTAATHSGIALGVQKQEFQDVGVKAALLYSF